jgi:hypothetical protein
MEEKQKLEEFGNFLNAKKKKINNYVYNKQKYYFILKTMSLFVFWGIFMEVFAWGYASEQYKYPQESGIVEKYEQAQILNKKINTSLAFIKQAKDENLEPVMLFSEIAAKKAPDMEILSLVMNDKQLSIEGTAADAGAVTEFSASLKNEKYKNGYVENISQKGNRVSFKLIMERNKESGRNKSTEPQQGKGTGKNA